VADVLDTNDRIAKKSADRRWLTMDFGSLIELAYGATIESATISIDGANGVTVSTITVGDYYVSAWFSGGVAGEYTVSFAVVLSDGTEVTRGGALVIT
jgi:hypothetical protein